MNYNPDEIFKGILAADRGALSRGITLIESQRSGDRVAALNLIAQCQKLNKKSRRLAITGSPGVGKSTLIESYGKSLVTAGRKLAVLAIDPSSELGGGSILGDKTRMNELSVNQNAFIRPSPTSLHLGGVHPSTKESIILCEAAGFENIIIETVGVGQSETEVRSLVDGMLLLILPGSGDDLQGIKKGIMEVADIVCINKSDGDRTALANQTRTDIKNALHLLRPKESLWKPKTLNVSGLKGSGMHELSSEIDNYFEQIISNGFFEKQRIAQDQKWFELATRRECIRYMESNQAFNQLKQNLKDDISSKQLLSSQGLIRIIEHLNK